MKTKLISYLGLFTSAGTLLCCALPAIMVTLGAGSAFASLLSAYPQLIWFSKNKLIVFGVAGLLLTISALVKNKTTCSIENSSCSEVKSASKYIFIFSVLMYLTGGFFAFIAPMLL